MPGHGPAPKDPSQRARRNKAPEQKLVAVQAVAAPALPDDEDWPLATRALWDALSEFPLSSAFIGMDWVYLIDTMRLHREFVDGALNLAGEIRLRLAKFGVTPEDRARLRVAFVEADTAERKEFDSRPSARERRGPLRDVSVNAVETAV